MKPEPNSLRSSLTVLLAAALIVAAAPLSHGAELLEEFNFESAPAYLPNWGAGYGGTYKPATGWKEPFRVTLDEANPHSGLAALKVVYPQTSSGAKILHTPGIKVPQGDESRLVDVRFFYRTKEMANANIKFQILQLDENGSAFAYVGAGKGEERLDASEEWKEVRINGPLSNKTVSIQLVWVVQEEMDGAEFWLDDISVERE